MEISRKHLEGALLQLPDNQFKKIWDIMKIIATNDELEEIAFDLMVGERVANDPECREFIPANTVLANLGITMEDLED